MRAGSPPTADPSLCTRNDACVAWQCVGDATPDPTCRVPSRGASVPTYKSSLGYKAKGSAVNRPGTPYTIDPVLRVQLKNGAVCWEAGYTSVIGFLKAKAKY